MNATKVGSDSRLALLITFALGIALGAIITWAVMSSSPAQVHIVEGHVSSVNADGTAIGITESSESYVIAGAKWRIGDGPWNLSFPTCLEPLSGGQKVRLGIVNFAPTDNAFGGSVVVWLECLD